MLLTIYYRKGCIKSRFLRAVLRVMDWDLREADADDPKSKAELIQLKTTAGAGTTPMAPAIYTTEAYSHEMYCIIEYLNERSPTSMYPDQPSMRLYARTVIHRVLRKLSTIWPDYRETKDPKNLLSYYDEIEGLIVDWVKNQNTLRNLGESTRTEAEKAKNPHFVELLFFSIIVEVNHLRPIDNKTILPWFKQLASRGIFLDLVAEPQDGYFNS